MFLILFILHSVVPISHSTSNTNSSTCRNQFLWPFNESSIWNTPIGSSAEFIPANLYDSATGKRRPPTQFHNDQDWIILTTEGDPSTPWIDDSGRFPGGCIQLQKNATQQISHFPSSLVVDCIANNNAAAILFPDGETIIQTQPLYRPYPSSPIISWYHQGAPQRYPWSTNIYGDGNLGAHGGSGLSAIGGTIRLGELLGSHPIRHALKLELWSKPYYYGGVPALQPETEANGGRNQYVWPATGSDGGSNIPGSKGGLYNGTNQWLAPGALLALPKDIVSKIQTTTLIGEKIKQALTNYGGYIVDDTGSKQNGAAICMEPGVVLEIERAYNVSFNITNPVSKGKSDADTAVYEDLLLIFQYLHVVKNNGPLSVGGGGNTTFDFVPPPSFCQEPPVKGVLHQVDGCNECDEEWCGGYLLESTDVEQGYTVGEKLSTWGCDNVIKGMTRVRNCDTEVVYIVDATAVKYCT